MRASPHPSQEEGSMIGRITFFGLSLALLLVGGTVVFGQKKEKEEDKTKYPRVDAAIGYKHDPSWPQKPKGYTWGHVPGIAIDRDDNVYVFTRAKPPVQVYTSAGKFVRAWGEDEIKNAH